MDQFTTPILFIIFNRPHETLRVFNVIKSIKPSKLYIAADGAKTSCRKLCDQARKIICCIDWDRDLKIRMNDQNMGCKIAVSSAISWFFSDEEEGIILEDDCLPDVTFFEYCTKLLEKYRYDSRVGHIGGSNFQKGHWRGDGSYYFSRYSHIWGWATWKRAWNLYNLNIEQYNDINNFYEFIAKNTCSNSERNYWIDKYVKTVNGKFNTWDYQWLFTLWFNNMKSVTPNVNLVSNIGFGESATHTNTRKPWYAGMQTNNLKKIEHPTNIYISKVADNFTYNHSFRRFFVSNIILALNFYIKKLIYEFSFQKNIAFKTVPNFK